MKFSNTHVILNVIKYLLFYLNFTEFFFGDPMANFYCEYCGAKYQSVQILTGAPCYRHPAGCNKGKHKLYEGSEKPQYTCKYCGQKYQTLQILCGAPCPRHPAGFNKGKHSPAR